MRKMNCRILGVLAFISLYLAFNAGSALAQCGLPGTPPCPTKKPGKKPKTFNKSSNSAESNSLNDTKIYKSGSTFFEKSAGQNLLVTYKENDKDLVFLMEALNYFSRENTGEMHLYVDLNGNGKIDVNDVRYKLIRDGDGYNLEAIYLSNKYFESSAVVGYSFIRTKNQSRAHPLFSITIPKTEVFYRTGEIHIRFEYWSEACPDCVVRIPAYNITGRGKVRDENGLLDFGPVKKMEFTP
jgi:hypothetical protein